MKFKMNTIFICIIFLLLGILLASLIFPNKCKEGMNFAVTGGTNCQALLDNPNMGFLYGSECGNEIRIGYNEENRADFCTGPSSGLTDPQIAMLSSVSKISEQELKSCDSGSGTDATEGESDSTHPLVNICEGDDSSDFYNEDGTELKTDCLLKLYQRWNNTVGDLDSGVTSLSQEAFCNRVKALLNEPLPDGSEGTVVIPQVSPFKDVDVDSESYNKFRQNFNINTSPCYTDN